MGSYRVEHAVVSLVVHVWTLKKVTTPLVLSEQNNIDADQAIRYSC